jgi:hypothetical protein
VRDGFRQLRVGASVDAQGLPARGYPDRACAPPRRQRRLEHACCEVDTVRRQLGDAVRDDRAREVDGLATRAAQWKVCN